MAAMAAVASCSVNSSPLVCCSEKGLGLGLGVSSSGAVAFAKVDASGRVAAVAGTGASGIAKQQERRRRRAAATRRVCAGGGSVRCSAAEGSSSSTATSTTEEAKAPPPENSWVPVIPVSALPKGERRLIKQDDNTVLLLWYKDQIFALENTSPAEGAYSEGLFNARLTPDGCIICPSTETTFDLKTGAIKDWYPTNPVLAFLTRPTRQLYTYPVKTDAEYVYVSFGNSKTGQSAELVFGGATQAGKTATDVSVDEVRMVVDENEAGFGFNPYTELINGRAAVVGVFAVLLTELVSGQGFLKGLGFLDFLYKFIK